MKIRSEHDFFDFSSGRPEKTIIILGTGMRRRSWAGKAGKAASHCMGEEQGRKN